MENGLAQSDHPGTLLQEMSQWKTASSEIYASEKPMHFNEE